VLESKADTAQGLDVRRLAALRRERAERRLAEAARPVPVTVPVPASSSGTRCCGSYWER